MQAYTSICDLLIVFSKNMAARDPALSTLVYAPDRSLKEKLLVFLDERVLIYDSTQSSVL